jgi:hypothetical protein
MAYDNHEIAGLIADASGGDASAAERSVSALTALAMLQYERLQLARESNAGLAGFVRGVTAALERAGITIPPDVTTTINTGSGGTAPTLPADNGTAPASPERTES